MKKLMALSLALLMTLSLVACGSKTEQPSTGSNSSDAEATGFVPSKNVTWICTSSAGGGSDIFSRQIADIMKNEDLVNHRDLQRDRRLRRSRPQQGCHHEGWRR